DDDALKAQTASNTLANRNMLRINTPLFWDLAQQHDNNEEEDEEEDESDSESEDGSYRDTDSDSGSESNSDSDHENHNNNNDNDNDNEEEEQGCRERTHTVVDLDSTSPCSAAAAATPIHNAGSPRTLAMQANKRTKRVRIDDSHDNAASMAFSGKKVRFDETKNRVHVHHRNSSIVSPPDSPTPGTTSTATAAALTATAPSTTTRPIVSALSRRNYSHQTPPTTSSSPSFSALLNSSFSNNCSHILASHSPDHFELSLQNTSQEVMDFASSLSRLMGGGGGGGGSGSNGNTGSVSSSLNGSQDSLNFLSPPLSQIPIGSPIVGSSSSPLRSFNSMFQASPPSPVRPAFLSAYSPPSSSSLSSCWSPLMDDNDDDDEDKDTTMMSPPLLPRPLSPSRPTPREKMPFSPRRPRNTGTLSSSSINTGMQATTAAATPNVARRFPAMLRREASNASFLDAYPASLAPEPENVSLPVPRTATTPPREGSPSVDSPMNHSAIAAAVLNMSVPTATATTTVPAIRLTKSFSDLMAEKSMLSKEFQFESMNGHNHHKRSASLDDGDHCGAIKHQQPHLSFTPRAMMSNSSLATPPDSQLR
ncbi:hypothetical protein BGZ58_001732, partial [Dissophora ornata]